MWCTMQWAPVCGPALSRLDFSLAGRGWHSVRYSLLRPLALAVRTGSVPPATILRVFILVPSHEGREEGTVAYPN